ADPRVMNKKEVDELLKIVDTLELRDKVIVELALVAGLRAGEIFGLRRGNVRTNSVNVAQRVYRGDIDTPKTKKSIRPAGLAGGLMRDLEAWLSASPDTGPDGWLFPSEKLDTPIWKDAVWRRWIRPKLKEKGLEWVNFQVLRRTHSSRM